MLIFIEIKLLQSATVLRSDNSNGANEGLKSRSIIVKGDPKEELIKTSSSPKKILFWNEAYGAKTYDIGLGKDVFRRAGCPVWSCETTDNRSSLPVGSFDAIVFHARSWTRTDIPSSRSAHQRYVFWSMEAPDFRFEDTAMMANFFNWTMTYRQVIIQVGINLDL